MSVRLISHVNADSDLIEAWLKYYCRLGISEFNIVVHGLPAENQRLLDLRDSYPIVIEDMYQGPFMSQQKKSRLDAILAKNPNQWVIVADSDEFVEFPYSDIHETIEKLMFARANLMVAPMLQRLKDDGTLTSPAVIDDPFETFAICSEDLYERMGSTACTLKCPLFFCTSTTQLSEEGNHSPPHGSEPKTSAMQGVTHHFKFRQTVTERLDSRINSAHSFRHESIQFREYLDSHSNRLPLEGAFTYSREELFRRKLLKKLSLRNNVRSVAQKLRIWK